MNGITVTCYGVCGGVAGWRSPKTGLPCSLCGGSGEVTTYSQRELADQEWDAIRELKRKRAERFAQRRDGEPDPEEMPEVKS